MHSSENSTRKLIRNAYKFDMVGIYFSRRIPKTTFWYTFKTIGAVAVETFNQFAPPDTEVALAPIRHKDGKPMGSEAPANAKSQR
jgi:hypothetical protein